MAPKAATKSTQRSAKRTSANGKTSNGFSDEEKAAARERVRELKALYNLGIDHLAVPVFNLFIYAVIAGLFGVLAAIFPSIRASRIDVLQAIATE